MIRTLIQIISSRKKNQGIFTSIFVIYLILYLIAIRDIQLTSAQNGITFSHLGRVIESSSFLDFRPIIKLTIEPVVIFISPINILIGLIISLLVSVNFLLLYIIIKRPKRCDISDTTGIFASLPALLSGTACCGPIIPIILGLQVTSTFLTLTKLAIPVSILLLLITTYFISSKV